MGIRALVFFSAAGRPLFIINHENTIYKKAVDGGPIPEVYPADSLKDGWAKLD